MLLVPRTRAVPRVLSLLLWIAPVATTLATYAPEIDAKKKRGGGKKSGGKKGKRKAAPPPAETAAAPRGPSNAELDKEVAAATEGLGIGRWRPDRAFREIGEDYEFPPVRLPPHKAASAVTPQGPAQGGEGAGEEPAPLIRLSQPMRLIPPPADSAGKIQPPRGSAQLATDRQAMLARRDRAALPTENLRQAPSQFCVRGQCFAGYDQVAAALYGRPGANPVFCAPARVGGKWSATRVECGRSWLATLGKWQPWQRNGQPSAAPEPGVLPPYACFGSPHLLKAHMILPGGTGQGGFHCRRRIFRVLASAAEKNQRDVNRRIALMCAEMRMQVWGEKYPKINSQYQEWCRRDARRVKEGICLPPKTRLPGPGQESVLPFMQLSREELLYFFGHKELFCRADRPGLTHMLFNREWARTFTCGVPRGLIESGPFEEGVQACALAPYTGEERHGRKTDPNLLKARVHCWQFARPTCEDVSRDQTLGDLHKSNVFDVFDTLKETRRTRDRNVWALYDLKDAEKLSDADDKFSFSDVAKDEATFGVKDFCRFVGDTKTLRCGYDKQTMAQWFELRKHEAASGCRGGFCARGAYHRGYFCGLYASNELFSGKPYWVCGIDAGAEGRRMLQGSRAICAGGRLAEQFQAASGSSSSLLCFERRFRFGEDAKTADILFRFRWDLAVREAAKIQPRFDKLLGWIEPPSKMNKGSKKKKRKKRAAYDAATQRETEAAKVRLLANWQRDAAGIIAWAGRNPSGHALGHRTTMRKWVLRSAIDSIKQLLAMRFPDKVIDPGTRPKKKKKKKKKGKQEAAPAPKTMPHPLNGLIDELRRGERAPDGRWYEDFRQEAADGERRIISPEQLEVALRVHHMFEVLEGARRIFLAQARAYADAAFAAAKKSAPVSRYEVYEAMRGANLPKRVAGQVFCVTDPDKRSPQGQREYVCGGSPLLVAGNVERFVRDRWAGQWARRSPDVREKLRAKLRARVNFGWCFGGRKGTNVDHKTLPEALSLRADSSPYQLEIPPSIGHQGRAKRGWMRCRGFQYSDEVWEHEKDMKSAGATALAKLGGGGGKAGKQTSKIMKMVGGLLSALSRLALPGFSNAIARVRDLVHLAGEFLDKWVGKFAEKAKPFWEKQQEAIKNADGAVAEAQGEVEKRQAAYHQAELFAAAAQGPAKVPAEEKKNEAKQALSDAQKELRDKKREAAETRKQVRKGKAVPGTGELLSELLEDLVQMASERVMAVVDPNARNLLQKGFKFVRSVLDPIAKAVIGALGSVPFVGGALAMLGQVAYSAAMDALEDLGYQAIRGVVERLLSKLLRAVLTPVLKVAQGKILQLAFAFCSRIAPDVCSGQAEIKFSEAPPKDAWLNRALACQPPVLDDRIHRDAALARAEVLETAATMRKEVATLARDLADTYLARYGLTLDGWMAAVGSGSAPTLAARITHDLGREAEALRASKPKRD